MSSSGSFNSSSCCPSSSPVGHINVSLDRFIPPLVALLLLWQYSCCYKVFYLFLSDSLFTSALINLGWNFLFDVFLFHFFLSLLISSCEFFIEQFLCELQGTWEFKIYVAVQLRTSYCLHAFTFTVGVVRVCSRLRLRWSPNVSSAADAKSAKLSTRVACTDWGHFSAGTNAVRRLLKLKWSICLTFLKIS